MAEAVLCRACGQPTQTAEQKILDTAVTLVTCTNREGKCDLCGYTLSLNTYYTRDLSMYRWREESWRQETP